MKKILSTAVLISLFCLAGCSNSSSNGGPTTTSKTPTTSDTTTTTTVEKKVATITAEYDHCQLSFEKDILTGYYVGDAVTFTISSVDEGYEVSSVKANDIALTAEGAKYTFEALESNTVSVTTRVKVANINKEENHGRVTLEKDVYAYGETVNFAVEWDEHYKDGNVYANGVELTKGEDADYPYSFTALVENTISVSGDLSDAIITFDVVNATVTTEKESYKYGEVLKFNVSIPEECDYYIDYVTVNGHTLEKKTDLYAYEYEIDNEAVTIKVFEAIKTVAVSSFAITANQSTVAFDKDEYAVNETASFTVTANQYFAVSKVELNGNELTLVDGRYSFPVSLSGVSIVVTTVYDAVDPTITVAGNVTSFVVLETNPDGMKLPAVTALDCLGNSITPVVSYKFNGEAKTDPGYKSEGWTTGDYAPGKHEWTFVATDSADETKTASTTITLTVAPKVLLDGNGCSYKVSQTTEANPKIYLNCQQSESGIEVRSFNTVASKKYYAEVKVNSAQQPSAFGLIHGNAKLGDGFIKEYLSTDNVKDVNTLKGINWAGSNDTHLIWNSPFNKMQRGLDLSGTFNVDEWASKDVVIGIGRNENTFYYFVNGILAESYVSTDFVGIDTLPGILFSGCKVGIDGQFATDVKVLSGDEAVTKIDAIANSSTKFGYLRNDNNNYATCTENNGELTFVAKDGQSYYNSIVASKLLMKGSSHISFRYTSSVFNSTDNYDLINLLLMNSAQAADPNSKAAKIAQWCFRHNASPNTNVLFSAAQTEYPWDYTRVCGGDGADFKWDVDCWDMDITVKVVGTKFNIQFTVSEYSKNGTVITNPGTYTSSVVESNLQAANGGLETPWYALTVQGHNKTTFTLSNLVIEPLIENN